MVISGVLAQVFGQILGMLIRELQLVSMILSTAELGTGNGLKAFELEMDCQFQQEGRILLRVVSILRMVLTFTVARALIIGVLPVVLRYILMIVKDSFMDLMSETKESLK